MNHMLDLLWVSGCPGQDEPTARLRQTGKRRNGSQWSQHQSGAGVQIQSGGDEKVLQLDAAVIQESNTWWWKDGSDKKKKTTNTSTVCIYKWVHSTRKSVETRSLAPTTGLTDRLLCLMHKLKTQNLFLLIVLPHHLFAKANGARHRQEAPLLGFSGGRRWGRDYRRHINITTHFTTFGVLKQVLSLICVSFFSLVSCDKPQKILLRFLSSCSSCFAAASHFFQSVWGKKKPWFPRLYWNGLARI